MTFYTFLGNLNFVVELHFFSICRIAYVPSLNIHNCIFTQPKNKIAYIPFIIKTLYNDKTTISNLKTLLKMKGRSVLHLPFLSTMVIRCSSNVIQS